MRYHRGSGTSPGMSLLELLLVIAILATLIGLLLPAVQKVRQAALRAAVCNQARQLVLGIHHTADTRGGLLSDVGGEGPAVGVSVFTDILPFIEGQLPSSQAQPDAPPSPLYRSPADPSYGLMTPIQVAPGQIPTRANGNISYAANPLVCRVGMRMEGIRDGTSTTILLSERYAMCGKSHVWSSFLRSRCYQQVGNKMVQVPCSNYDGRRATFADADYDDVLPRTDPVTGATNPSIPGMTFGVGVPPLSCDPRIPQTALPSGLVVGLADGSVRSVKPGVSPHVFWGAVTPAGGEVLGDW